RADPSLTPTQLHNFEVFYVTLSVVMGLIGIGLWILMAVMNRRGHSWARIVATVLFGIYTLFLVLGFSRAGAAVGTLVSLLTWLIGLVTIVLLWRPQSPAELHPPGRRHDTPPGPCRCALAPSGGSGPPR